MTRQWNRVTVVGCGLIGASFAMALRDAAASDCILGWDTDASVLDEALEHGVIDDVDRGVSLGHSSSDLIYLAMPVKAIIDFLSKQATTLRDKTLITDAGSTKVEVCLAARKHLPARTAFVGGHPIAGSQLSGVANARADLFRGASYVLTLEPEAQRSSSMAAFERTLEAIGARVEVSTAAAHDRAMAYFSHLPQLLSSALAATIKDQAGLDSKLAGPGYRDMTRLAASPWSVWRDIFATNALPVSDALKTLISELERACADLRNSDLASDKVFPAICAQFASAQLDVNRQQTMPPE